MQDWSLLKFVQCNILSPDTISDLMFSSETSTSSPRLASQTRYSGVIGRAALRGSLCVSVTYFSVYLFLCSSDSAINDYCVFCLSWYQAGDQLITWLPSTPAGTWGVARPWTAVPREQGAVLYLVDRHLCNFVQGDRTYQKKITDSLAHPKKTLLTRRQFFFR